MAPFFYANIIDRCTSRVLLKYDPGHIVLPYQHRGRTVKVQIKYEQVKAFITKDGSTIRELVHPGHSGNRNLSLAEAIVPAGSSTALHLHRTTEEIYHVTQGEAQMTLGMKTFTISAGDTILIPPLTAHCLHNDHDTDLHVLCACSPAYSDADTELLDY